MEKIKTGEEIVKRKEEWVAEAITKINELVEWTNKIGERIGLMEDEYKQHLYGPGYEEQGLERRIKPREYNKRAKKEK